MNEEISWVDYFTDFHRYLCWWRMAYATGYSRVSYSWRTSLLSCQVDGFELTIEKPTWSPFKGYTIRWAVTANSKEIYSFVEDGGPGFEYLERYIDGQWYRLTYSQDTFPFNNLEFSLGGDSTGLQGSIVQKYDYYGTRLEAGTYRVVLEMKAKDGTPHYLAAEFDVE